MSNHINRDDLRTLYGHPRSFVTEAHAPKLENLFETSNVGLLFMIPGVGEFLRVYGEAYAAMTQTSFWKWEVISMRIRLPYTSN